MLQSSIDEFEPSKYLSALILSINDGAKSAQSWSLVYILVGVYLIATSFSTTDEDLFRGNTVTIAQIGASLPVSFSFAIAPFVFVFMHIYTLARYGMLASNVHAFLAELENSVKREADQERCRQLLANVEFIQSATAPTGSSLYSPMWRLLFVGMIVIFPIFSQVLVEIGSLRYQSDRITMLQLIALLADMYAITWFFGKNPFKSAKFQKHNRLTWLIGCLTIPILLLNLLYIRSVSSSDNFRQIQYDPTTWHHYSTLLSNPLDYFFCPKYEWGCRYLQLDRRTLVGHVWDNSAIVALRGGSIETPATLAAVEGLVLRNRSFRFAALDRSLLFGADLTGADLTKAHLNGAGLRGAQMGTAKLLGANLSAAQLQGVDLSNATLDGANLSSANLVGANLRGATLRGADLSFAQLEASDLSGADLEGAILYYANLEFANLSGASWDGADFKNAKLQGATLSKRLRLLDLRNVQFTGSLSADEKQFIGAIPNFIAEPGRRHQLERRLQYILGSDRFTSQLNFGADPYDSNHDPKPPYGDNKAHILVSKPDDPIFETYVEKKALISTPTPEYRDEFVAELTYQVEHWPSSNDEAIPDLIVLRFANQGVYDSAQNEPDKLLYNVLICQLLANAKNGKIRLDADMMDYFEGLYDGKSNSICAKVLPKNEQSK